MDEIKPYTEKSTAVSIYRATSKSLRILLWHYTKMHRLIQECSSWIKLSEKAVFQFMDNYLYFFFQFWPKSYQTQKWLIFPTNGKFQQGKKNNQKYQARMASKRNYIPGWILHYRQWCLKWEVRRKLVLQDAWREPDTPCVFTVPLLFVF